ncbi:hypothetical protein F0562_007353 [Nyssa sinensis]|uniref:C2 domain-containing protein n=1 Tax=Nyssa sinensis TaxID=561372 RepID=A0A5J5A681_9ASTE|nr:hypothetical protein F0562_007353 [Nyssa sinensis]
MGFFLGLVFGFAVGIGLVVGLARLQNIRSKGRSELAKTVAAFARMTVQDSRKILPPEYYPSWLTWLNLQLDKIWPYVNEAASELIRTSVEPILEQYRPWDGNPKIALDIKTRVGVGLPIQVKNIGFTGVFRLIFKPLVDEFPCFGAISYSLREKKKLDFTLKVIGGEISAMPGISDAIEETIRDSIEDSITWPIRKIITILPGDYSDLELKPVGTLEVKLIQAKELTNKDIVGKSDPYAVLFIRPNNQLNPIWNEHFEFIVEDASTQHLTVRVFDDEGVQAAELIGCAQVALKDLEPGKVKDVWLKLVKDLEIQRDNKNRGQVHLELLYCPFGTESAFTNPFNPDFRLTSLEKAIKTGIDGSEAADIKKSATQKRKDVIFRGVLSVTVISAEDLPAVDLMGKSDPYVVLIMKKSEQKFRTRVLNDSLNPVWNQTFDFIVEDGLHDLLILEVWDHDTFGKVSVSTSNLNVWSPPFTSGLVVEIFIFEDGKTQWSFPLSKPIFTVLQIKASMERVHKQDNQHKLRLLQALKKASKDLHKKPICSKPESDAIKAILQLESEAEAKFSTDPSLSKLSELLLNLKTSLQKLEQSQQYGLWPFLCCQITNYDISKIANSIQIEAKGLIDQEIIRNLVRVLQESVDEDEKMEALIQFEKRVSMGFDRDLQEVILKGNVFSIIELMLCYSTCSRWVREQLALAIVALVRFNKDVFVGQVLMGPTIKTLMSMASYQSIQILSSLIRLIRSPLVYELESNGGIPRVISLLNSKDVSIRLATIDCILEFAYYARREAIEAMLEEGLIEKLVQLQRLEFRSDLIEMERFDDGENRGICAETELGMKMEGEENGFLENCPFMSCVARFVVQLEMGDGLEQGEKRTLKQEILRRVREASVSDAEAINIVAELCSVECRDRGHELNPNSRNKNFVELSWVKLKIVGWHA